MRSERKIRANRANARASTGAKTADGKLRSARNALRHALSLPVHSDPKLSEAVETLACEIAGSGSNAPLQELARHIAEAQIDLCRVRHARYQFLSRALNDPYYDSSANRRRKAGVLRSLLRPDATDMPVDLIKFLNETPEGPRKFAIILSQKTEQLLAFDRYERRALSRRKFAIRAFYEARQRNSDKTN
jgi:hypothetical protein